ncbi:hypothetical protein [Belnapia rosea]|uniref:PhnA-like protein n=1 Tax=Belnapia rosea TaxID=938405 RepID=A0A1G6SMI1_9PROT|nr:hypothetical protein [Belnapia rosea]SDB61438.1 hypothetical protein SAMN02927895_02501 [Belnapia rosea]SDD17336.1 hypothetical protein SAMN04487779_100561 [Belnapia rosea]
MPTQTMGATVAPGTATGLAEGTPTLQRRVSWGAILAGGVVAVAVGTMLSVLGVAIGASAVDATQGQSPEAGNAGIIAGAWLLISNLIGLAVGGYVAARLSGSADRTDSTLHGLSVWAIGYLLSAVLLGNVIAGTAATATQGASSVLGGLAQGAGQAASAAAGPASQMASQIDPSKLVERAQTALRTGGDPAAMSSDQRNAEIGQLLTRRVTDGNLPQGDRDRLSRLVAAEYNIAPDEANRRLQQVEQQATETAQAAERQAREAADAAATAGAVAAYWIFAAMLLGAVAAVLGARAGTRNAAVVARRYA